MPSFTPPTHTEYVAPPGYDRLWSRVPYQRGDGVLVEDGVVTVVTVLDGDRMQAADAVFKDGVTADWVGTDPSPIPAVPTPDEEVALVSAGFELSIYDETWPVWLSV